MPDKFIAGGNSAANSLLLIVISHDENRITSLSFFPLLIRSPIPLDEDFKLLTSYSPSTGHFVVELKYLNCKGSSLHNKLPRFKYL